MNKNSGFGLLEVLIAVGLLAILLGGAVILGSMVLRSSTVNKHRLEASGYNQESIEAIHQLRDSNWKQFGSTDKWDNGFVRSQNFNLLYHPVFQDSSKTWKLESGEEIINGKENVQYTRSIKFEKVKADSDLIKNEQFVAKDIIYKVIAETKWQDYGQEESIIFETFISNWKQL